MSLKPKAAPTEDVDEPSAPTPAPARGPAPANDDDEHDPGEPASPPAALFDSDVPAAAPSSSPRPLVVSDVLAFAWRVLRRFMRNKGIVLAGGVAYNAFLSLVPLLFLVVVVLTFFVDESQALGIMQTELRYITGKTQAEALTGELRAFLANRHLVGGIGFLVLIFFSSLAFRMLEESVTQIFSHRDSEREASKEKSGFWASALRPYAFAGLIALALIAVTTVSSVFGVRVEQTAMDTVTNVLLLFVGFVGEVLLFSAIYWILPASHVAFRRALAGGLVAALLWEGVRTLMVWYFSSLSLVSVIYGSFATVIIILLSLEVATIIVLLGAQVIAEIEHSYEQGLRWFEVAPDDPLAD